MNVSTFNRATLKAFRVDIDKALSDVANKYGINLESGNVTFQASNFSMKIKGDVVNSDGIVQSKEVTNLESFKKLDGLKFGYGDTFRMNGTTFRITGYKPSRRKYPVSGENVTNGRSFKFALEDVNRQF